MSRNNRQRIKTDLSEYALHPTRGYQRKSYAERTMNARVAALVAAFKSKKPPTFLLDNNARIITPNQGD